MSNKTFILGLLLVFITTTHGYAMQIISGNKTIVSSSLNQFLPTEQLISDPASDFNRSYEPQVTAKFDKSPSVRVRPDISATSYMVIDPHTGTEIISHNANIPLSPASLTKMMTAYVVAEYIKQGKIDLQAEVPVSEKAQQTKGSSMFLQSNRKVTVDQLLLGLISVSGNDAAVALAEYTATTEEDFVDLMNSYAQALGMINCLFTNSHGLHHPDMLCSLNDFMILAQAIINNHFSFYKRYFAVKEYTYNGITQKNRNRLLFYAPDEIDGMKTGNTAAAGYNLIVSAVREYRLIAGVMGSKGLELRNTEVSKLLTHTYVYYGRYLIYNKEEKILEVEVHRGKAKLLKLGLIDDLYFTLPYVKRGSYKVKADIPGTIRAPIKQGEKIGELVVFFDDSTKVIKRPLVALESIEEANFVVSLWDEVAIWLGL